MASGHYRCRFRSQQHSSTIVLLQRCSQFLQVRALVVKVSFVLRSHARRVRATLPDDLVRKIDCLLDAFVGGIVEGHINFAFVFKHAKTTRWSIELADKRCRENVLASVLLDVIEPSQPIDLAVNCLAHWRNWS